MKGALPSASALLAGLVVWLVAPRAAQAAEVVSAVVDVEACAPLDDGRVLAASSGGLGVVAKSGEVTRVLTSVDGLPDTRVHALLLEGDTAWIGTERGVAEVSLTAPIAIRQVVTGPPVHALARHDGALYAGTWGHGTKRVLTSELAATTIGPSIAKVTSLASFGGELYAGTEGAGLFRGASAVEGAPRSVTSLAPVGTRLYVGASEGLSSLDAHGALRVESHDDVRALSAVGGSVAAATVGAGIVSPSSRTLGPRGEPLLRAIGARGDAMCAAGPTHLYAGSIGALHVVASSGLTSNDVSAIVTRGSRTFVGTFDRGLFVIDASSSSTKSVQDAAIDRRVNALAKSDDGAIWVATARGLARVTDAGAARRFTTADGLPSDEVHSVVAMPGGAVLAGTSRGAAIVRGDTVTPIGEKEGLKARAVWAVATVDDATLFGTSHGLWLARGLASSRPTWRRFSVADGTLADDWVTAIAVGGNGEVFVGTYSHGVTRLSDLNHPHVEQLGGGYVNLGGLLVTVVDGGPHLFAATMDGLLERPIGASVAPATWASRTDVPGQNVTALATADGPRVWAGTRSGLAVIH